MVRQRIREILRNYHKDKIVDDRLTPSAVIVPLFYSEGECHVFFTERSDEVNFHKGQICFPGGTKEAGDASLLDTALREASEEIGLDAGDVEILGELDDNLTVTTSYVISPFVAFIPYPYPFKLDPREIKRVFSVPLSALMDERICREEHQTFDGKTIPVYFYEYEGHVIWGATARILKRFIELLSCEGGGPR
jgi:8-oxo-dGTP pyrophosphatase MutT (NUDIX family)